MTTINAGDFEYSASRENTSDQAPPFETVDSLTLLLAELSVETPNYSGHLRLLLEQMIEVGNDYLRSMLEQQNYARLAEDHRIKTESLLKRLRELLTLLDHSDQHNNKNGSCSVSSNTLRRTIDEFTLILARGTPSSTEQPLYHSTDQVVPTCSGARPADTPTEDDGESTADIKIKAFGDFKFLIDGEEYSESANTKGKLLLKYLLLNRQKVTPKEELMELLWPAHDAISARNNLNVVVYGLRQGVKPALKNQPLILFKDGGYTLNPEIHIECDFEKFDDAFSQALHALSSDSPADALPHLAHAVSLYTGTFMEGDIYTDWLLPVRESYKQKYIQVLEAMDAAYASQDDVSAQIDVNRKILEADACHESAHKQLMKLYNQSGQRHLAARQFAYAKEKLNKELDIPPGEELQKLAQELKGL